MDIQHEHTKIQLNKLQQIAISVFWLGYQLFFSSMTLLILPIEIEKLAPNSYRGFALGISIAIGATVNTIGTPSFGAWSDRYTGFLSKRTGKRAPFLIVGTLGLTASLFAVAGAAYSEILPLFIGTWFVTMIFASMVQGPYSAIIPDCVLREQTGVASGWMGVMTMLGNAAGSSVGFFYGALGIFASVSIIVAVLFVTMTITVITMCSINVQEEYEEEMLSDEAQDFAIGTSLIRPQRENLVEDQPASGCCGKCKALFDGVRRPFLNRNFGWLFISRFFMGMGVCVVQQFILYFLKEIIPKPYNIDFFGKIFQIPDEKSASALLLIILLSCATVSALIGGFLSDRVNKKGLVYFSAGLQAIVICFAIIPFFQRFEFILSLAGFFGIGYGIFQSVDWTLATQVLSSSKDFGKDMAIWQLSGILSQIIALITGSLFDILKLTEAYRAFPALGYCVVFSIAGLCFFLSAIFICNLNLVSNTQAQRIDSFFISSDENHQLDDRDLDDDSLENNTLSSSDEGGLIQNKSIMSQFPSVKSSSNVSSETSKNAIDEFVSGNIDLQDISFESSAEENSY